MKDCAETRGPDAWDLDFSFSFLRGLYGLLAKDRRLALLGDAPKEVATGDRIAFIRHDLDVNVARGRALAEFEATLGIRSTYHVMLKSRLYEAKDERRDLEAIASAGHEIGLHFDAEDLSNERLAEEIAKQCTTLEAIIGAPVRSMSFHIPTRWPNELWDGVSTQAGRVSGYGREIAGPGKYLSDSCGRWREGDPRLVIPTKGATVLQVLIHPVWWGEEHIAPPDRLGLFTDEVARKRGSSFEAAAEDVYQQVLYRPRKPSAG